MSDLLVRWSKREKALVYQGEKVTAPILAHLFEGLLMDALYGGLPKDDPRHGKTIAQELDARGFDVSTLRFSIKRKAAAP